MAAGDYTRTTWQNGAGVGHPPINEDNLNNIEEKILELDTLLINAENYRFDSLKRYFWARNCKEIHMFDDEDAWGEINGNTSLGEPSNFTGNEDVSFYNNGAGASDIGMDDTITGIDLTEFNDEEASTTDDVICLNVFVLDHTGFTADLTLKLGTNAANYYSTSWAMNEDGRVTFQAKKSDFVTGAGAPNWNAITYVSLETTTGAGELGNHITGLSLMMYRNDPDNDGYGNPFQIYDGSAWSNFFEQEKDDAGPPVIIQQWNLHYDPNLNDVCIQLLNDSNDNEIYNGLKIRSGIINFVWKSIMHCRYDDYSSIMTWYIDSDNYACAWIDDDDFTLLVNEGGAPHSETFTLNTSLDYGERLEITLEKNSDTLRAILEKGNEIVKVLEYETSIDAVTQGDLYFGYDDVGLCLIPDFMISNVNNMDLDNWDKPKITIKKYDTSRDTTIALTDDPELYVFLPPNSMFEILLVLAYYNDDADGDINTDWEETGDIEYVTKKFGLGIPTNTTDARDTNVKYAAYPDATTNVSYGTDGGTTYPSILQDLFIVKTGVNGGKLAFRWGQSASKVTPTVVEAGSYIKTTKIEQLQQNL